MKNTGYRPGLTFEEFVKALDEIKKAREVYDKFYKLSREYNDVLGDYDPPMPTGYFLAEELIGKALGLGEDDIVSWWIGESEWGEKFVEGSIEDDSLPEDHKYHKPVLKTYEDLYEYCLFLGEEYYKMKVDGDEDGSEN